MIKTFLLISKEKLLPTDEDDSKKADKARTKCMRVSKNELEDDWQRLGREEW